MKKMLQNPQGKDTGYIDTEHNRYVTIRKPEHFMIKYQGFGISEDILNQLMTENVHTIFFIYRGKEEDKVYHIPLREFVNSPKLWDDNGDKQRFVSISDMFELK